MQNQPTEMDAREAQARALAKYLRVSIRTARKKVEHAPFWLRRIYAMHQELTPEQRQRVETALAGVETYRMPTGHKMTLNQYRGKVKRGLVEDNGDDA